MVLEAVPDESNSSAVTLRVIGGTFERSEAFAVIRDMASELHVDAWVIEGEGEPPQRLSRHRI